MSLIIHLTRDIVHGIRPFLGIFGNELIPLGEKFLVGQSCVCRPIPLYFHPGANLGRKRCIESFLLPLQECLGQWDLSRSRGRIGSMAGTTLARNTQSIHAGTAMDNTDSFQKLGPSTSCSATNASAVSGSSRKRKVSFVIVLSLSFNITGDCCDSLYI